MNKKTFSPFWSVIFVIFLVALLSFPVPLPAQDTAKETDQILTAAESLFKAMQEKRYSDIWIHLTKKSQDGVIESVMKASAKSGQELDKDKTSADFAAGGVLAKAYWGAYLEKFNPDMVLQQCTWKVGTIRKEEAQLILQYKKAEKPAILQMRKENGGWKTGLEETFGILRWIIK